MLHNPVSTTKATILSEGHSFRMFQPTVNRGLVKHSGSIPESNISLVLNETTNCFNSTFLTLNCEKSHFLQFLLKNKEIQMQISSNSVIVNTNCTKFLGLNTDSTVMEGSLSLNYHRD
jgi:hypothetical protein